MARYVRRVKLNGRWTTKEFFSLYDAMMHDKDAYGWLVALHNAWRDTKRRIRRML